MNRSGPRRARSALAAIATAVLLAPATGVSAQAPTTTDAAEGAAGWLSDQFVDEEEPERHGARLRTTFDFGTGPFTYDDHGLTADAVYGLAAAGTADDRIAAAAAWLDDPEQVAAYAGNAEPDIYAGATAKLIILADAVGADPRDFGGQDLVDRLEGLETEDGRYADAFDDTVEWGADWSNVITQSLAIVALERVGGGASQEAVAYLASQACEGGGFALQLSDDPGDGEACDPEVDATGFAVQALVAAGADSAARQAGDWLLGERAGDGSFGSADADRNSNSTGLASAALGLLEEDQAARDGARWIASVQRCDGSLPFAPDDEGDTQRATAQGLFGLAGVDLATVTSGGAQDQAPDFVCPRRFPDVAYGSSVHAPAIDHLARHEIVRGDRDGSFGPKLSLTRGQVASLIGRAVGIDEQEGSPFTDLGRSPHAGFINALAELEIVRGYGDRTYRPSQPVTRDQFAALLARWLGLELDPDAEDAFGDIGGNVHRSYINALAEAGVARGSDGSFHPKRELARDQAASLLLRTLDLAEDG